MSYVALYNKYRPQSFDDVVGQEVVVKTLQKMIESDRIANGYLFVGDRGLGKTTLAKIFSKAINCTGDGPVPCNNCPSCKSINSDSSFDLVELDAASNRGVDTVRDVIINKVQYKPRSRYKVYIIDECFHKDTTINTPYGYKRISDVVEGDVVFNMTGTGIVKKVHTKDVSFDRLCIVRIDGVDTLTTKDHLYFTSNGWVSAKNLKKGDIVYANNTLSNLYEEVCCENNNTKNNKTKIQNTQLLQSGCYTTTTEALFGNRRKLTQDELHYIERQKENNRVRIVRVESVTFYEQGNNDELFRRYISNNELQLGYIRMYDLSVTNNESYYANNVLVHNCHMMTQEAWNALLKTLETPPPYVVFIFCTTNPEKVPKTIISRLQVYYLKNINNDDIVNRLKYICKQESFVASDDALYAIARYAKGGMRDSISALDQISAFTNNIQQNDVLSVLGMISESDCFELFCSLLMCDYTAYANKISELIINNKDILEAYNMISIMTRVAVNVSIGNTIAPNDLSNEMFERLSDFIVSKNIKYNNLIRLVEIIVDNEYNIKRSYDKTLVLLSIISKYMNGNKNADRGIKGDDSNNNLNELYKRLDAIEKQLSHHNSENNIVDSIRNKLKNDTDDEPDLSQAKQIKKWFKRQKPT